MAEVILLPLHTKPLTTNLKTPYYDGHMNTLLAIDSSTHTLSIALEHQGRVFERHEYAPREHGALLLPWIEALLKEASIALGDVDALACGVGPGGFTSIRLGVGVAQAIAAAHQLPVVPVSSLQVIAQQSAALYEAQAVLVAQDARMGEVYWGCYAPDELGLMRPVVADRLCAPDLVEVPDAGGPWVAVGDAWSVYPEALRLRVAERDVAVKDAVAPHARALLRLGAAGLSCGEGRPAREILPVYLRGRSAWVTK